MTKRRAREQIRLFTDTDPSNRAPDSAETTPTSEEASVDTHESQAKELIVRLLREAAVLFLQEVAEADDPRWFLTMANASLTIEASKRGTSIPCPLFPAYLPPDIRHELEAAGLLKPTDVV